MEALMKKAKDICPRAEWCDKTRKGEFAATVLAGFFFLVVLVMLAPGMIALKLLDWVYGKLYWVVSNNL